MFPIYFSIASSSIWTNILTGTMIEKDVFRVPLQRVRNGVIKSKWWLLLMFQNVEYFAAQGKNQIGKVFALNQIKE